LKKTLQKMHWKMINLKSINKGLFLSLILSFIIFKTQAQIPEENTNSLRDTTITGSDPTVQLSQAESPLDTMKNNSFQRYKIDGVAAVIGEYLILESDIEKGRLEFESQMDGEHNITDCEIIGHLMENKLFSHAALQDSTVHGMVTDGQVLAQVEQQINHFVQRVGSMKKLLELYRKDSEEELRDELFKIDKEMQLAEAMQNHITDEIEVTPEEVREFFNSIPKDELPRFSDEVEIAQITIKPKIPQAEIDKVVNQLRDMREDIVENGASFSTKAVLYSQDGTSMDGGKMRITRQDPLDKDFKEIAFSLREGEVSEPFKSSFGYHIVQVDKVLGQEREIRHIILMPKETKSSLEEAKQKADSIKTIINAGEITFKEAAKKYSDDEETSGDGGQLINPETGDSRFELTKIDPRMYSEVKRLKEGEISRPLSDQTRTGQKYYKIITVTGLYPEHVADYSKDYTRIKDFALRNKQRKEIHKWRKDEIDDTYIKVSGDYKDCEFQSNWLKN